jgi:hypothetical protein
MELHSVEQALSKIEALAIKTHPSIHCIRGQLLPTFVLKQPALLLLVQLTTIRTSKQYHVLNLPCQLITHQRFKFEDNLENQVSALQLVRELSRSIQSEDSVFIVMSDPFVLESKNSNQIGFSFTIEIAFTN